MAFRPRDFVLFAKLAMLTVSTVAAQVAPDAAPGGTILGVAVSDATEQPIGSVAVSFRRMSDSTVVAGVVTDAAGRFVREGLPPGDYRVELTSVGHAPVTRDGIRVAEGALRHDLGMIRLGVAVVQLEGVTAAARGAAVTFETDRSVYHIQEMPAAQGGMATDALRAIPELEVDVDDNIRARGGTPEIYLDGRPLPMRGEARTAFLRSLRADRIERVEYIPNPSARFEAEGQSGIVNIVLRRDMGLGFSGSVSANAGTRGTQNLSTRLNYQRGSLTFFGGGLIGLSQSETSTLNFRQNLAADPVTSLEQATDRETDRTNGSADLTTEMKISDRSTAWLIGRYNGSGLDDHSLSEFIHFDAQREATDRYDRANTADNGTHGYSGAFGFRRVVQPQRDEFSIELRYNENGSDADTENLRRPKSLDGDPVATDPDLTRVGTDSDDGAWTLQADLSRPAGSGGRVDAGYRGNLRSNTIAQEVALFVASSGAPTTEQDHRFRYLEDSHAAYLTLNQQWGPFGIQAGLRAEHVTGTVTASSLDEEVALRHTGVFPSANISWSLAEGRQLRISYAKRIQRPMGSMLNPMNTSPADPFNRSVGNPYLGPTDVHTLSTDVSWTGSVGTLRATQFVFRGSNLWDQIRTVDENGVMTAMMRNVSAAGQYGLSLSGSLREFGPFSGSGAIGIYHLNFDAGNLAGVRSTTTSSWNTNVNLVTTVTPTLRVQTTGFYAPEQVSPQGRFAGFRSVNVSATQRIMEDRAVLSLSIVDPFNLSRTTFTSQQQTHEQTSRSTNRIRRATLSISYNFGRAPQSSRRVIQDDPTGGGGGISVPGGGVQE